MIPSDFSDETSENSVFFHAADEKNFVYKRITGKKKQKKTSPKNLAKNTTARKILNFYKVIFS